MPKLAPGDPDRRAERGQHAPAEVLGHRRAVEVFGEDRVLVAAQPRHHVGAAHGADDAAAGLDQQLVADCMPHAIVDQLEAIEVEEQHGEAGVGVAARAADRARQPFQQLHPVGQAGQRIVGGLVGQLALGAHALAHLLDQLGIGFGQFAGALADALFEPGMRLHPLPMW